MQAFSDMISSGSTGVIGVFGGLVASLLVVFVMIAVAYKRAKSGGGKKPAVDKTKAVEAPSSNAADYVPYLNDAIASMKSEIVQMDAKLAASQGGATVASASPDQSAQLIALQSQLTAKDTELTNLRAELANAQAAAAQANQAAQAAQASAAAAPAPETTPAPAAAPVDDGKIADLEAKVAAAASEKAELEGKLKEEQDKVAALTQERDDLKAALLAKEKELEEAKASAGEAGGGDDSELKEKISFLESQLAEYEVIEEDIANLKKLQEEKEALENRVKELEGGGGGAAAAEAPAPAAEEPKKEESAGASGGDEFAAEEGVDDGSAIANEFEEFLDEGNASG